MKQRRFDLINEQKGIEIMIDFGKENSKDWVVEVVSRLLHNNKKIVLDTRFRGYADKWDYKRINEFLADFYDCKDLDEEEKEWEAV